MPINSTTYEKGRNKQQIWNQQAIAGVGWRWKPSPDPESSVTVDKAVSVYKKSDVVKTPNYRERKKNGQYLAPLPYYLERSKNVYPNGTYCYNYKGTNAYWQSVSRERQQWDGALGLVNPTGNIAWGLTGAVPHSVPSSVQNAALTAALLDLRGSKVNLAQAWAERMQTVNLLKDTATRITSAIFATSRRDWKAVARSLAIPSRPILLEMQKRGYGPRLRRGQDYGDVLASNWLALQYGWKPLLSDVYGSAESLAEAVFRDGECFRFTAKAQRREQSTSTLSFSTSQATFFERSNRTRETKCKVTLTAVLDPAMVSRVASTLGFSNPALLAWELVPFSFIVDWFLPIGNFLASLDTGNGVTYLGGCYSTVRRGSDNGSWFKGGPLEVNTGQRETSAMIITASRQYFRFDRNPIYTLPRAPLPSLKNPFSFVHLANGLALLKLLTGHKSDRPAIPKHLLQHNAYRLRSFSPWF